MRLSLVQPSCNRSLTLTSLQWYPYQEATGYNADMDITWVGSSIEEGIIGEITIGVNLWAISLTLLDPLEVIPSTLAPFPTLRLGVANPSLKRCRSYISPELSTQYAAFDVDAYVSEGLDTLYTSSAVATSTSTSTSSSALSSSAAVTTSLVSSTSTKGSSMTKKHSTTKSPVKKSAEAVKKSMAAAAAAAKKSKQAAQQKKQAQKSHQ